jgi:hypothetical protein
MHVYSSYILFECFRHLHLYTSSPQLHQPHSIDTWQQDSCYRLLRYLRNICLESTEDMYVYIYIYIYICRYTCWHTCMNVYLDWDICTYINTYTHIHVYTNYWAPLQHICMHTYIQTHVDLAQAQNRHISTYSLSHKNNKSMISCRCSMLSPSKLVWTFERCCNLLTLHITTIFHCSHSKAIFLALHGLQVAVRLYSCTYTDVFIHVHTQIYVFSISIHINIRLKFNP